MNKTNLDNCLVGHDDDGLGYIIGVIIVVAIVLAIITYGGAFIGGFHVLKNYFLSFKHNVIDDNLPKAIEE